MTQEWLIVYKELLYQRLFGRAFFVLATFAVAEIDLSEFNSFVTEAIPWSIESMLNMVSVGNSVWLIEWSKAMVQVVTKLLNCPNNSSGTNILLMISNYAEIARIIQMVYELESNGEHGYLCLREGLYELNILKGSYC